MAAGAARAPPTAPAFRQAADARGVVARAVGLWPSARRSGVRSVAAAGLARLPGGRARPRLEPASRRARCAARGRWCRIASWRRASWRMVWLGRRTVSPNFGISSVCGWLECGVFLSCFVFFFFLQFEGFLNCGIFSSIGSSSN